jgi:MFS family permease
MDTNEMRELRKTGPRFFYGYVVVLISLLIMLISYGTRTTFGVFFKPLQGEFDWNRASISGAVTLSLITQGLWGMVMGRLNDKVGPRVVLTLCCFLSGLGFLLLAQINNLWEIYVYYGVIIGFGMGGVFVALLSTVSRWFVKRRGAMTGVVLTGIGASQLILSPLATWLISVFDWRLAYVIMGGMILVIGTALAQFMRRDPNSNDQLPDGQRVIEAGLADSNREGLSLNEARRTWQFWSVMLIFMCIGYFTFTIITHYIPHMTDLGITAVTAANIMALSGAATIVGGIMLGTIADRIGPRRVLAICFLLMAASVFLLITFGDLWIFYIIAVIFGLGSGGAGVSEPMVVAELFGMKSHGSVLGVVSFGFTLGGAIGPLITGYIFDASGSYEMAFIVCVSIGIVGFILTTLLKPSDYSV